MKRILVFALFVLSCVSQGSIAGMITFGGDLAGVPFPVVTPDLIAVGPPSRFEFGGSTDGIGTVSGAVRLEHEAGQVGRIVLENFVFTSDRPGRTDFSINIVQDFAHPASSADILGTLSPAGKLVFTDSSQSGEVLLSGTLEDKPFEIIRCPQMEDDLDCGGSALVDVTALAPISASMSLDMHLTNGEISGSQINLGLVVLKYDALLVPEPNSVVLLGAGLISLLGYGWRRRSAQPSQVFLG
jgi:PEP-CTERM motif